MENEKTRVSMRKMDIKEIVRRLEPWKARHAAFHAQLNAFRKLTNADHDSELMRPVMDIWIAYTAAVSEIVGDTNEWLQWYECECQMGDRPLKVSFDDVAINVKTLRQLARVILWKPDISDK